MKHREINRAVLRGCKGCMKDCQHYMSSVSERVDDVGTGDLYKCNSVNRENEFIDHLVMGAATLVHSLNNRKRGE